MSPKMTAKDYGKLPKTKVFAGKRYNLSRPLDSKTVAKDIVKEQRSYGGGGSFKGSIEIESEKFDALPEEVRSHIGYGGSRFLQTLQCPTSLH